MDTRSSNKLLKCIAILIALGFLALFPSTNAGAQNLKNHNWYFGSSQYGIVFNISDNQPNLSMDQNPGMGTGGAAIATDRNSGDLLFYTDGNTVFDARHNPMPNGGGITGDPAGNQMVAISPRPNNPGEYYVLTNDGGGTIYYSIVDMNQAGNATGLEPDLGNIVTKNQNSLISGVHDPIFVIESQDGDNVMLVQDNTTGEFRVYSIDEGGFTLLSSLPVTGNIIAENFAYHPGSGNIAVSPQNTNENIQILNFDPVTNTLSYVDNIPNSANADAGGVAVYDTEWSLDGTKLFFSRPATGEVYRYDFNNAPTASLDVINPPAYRSYGLQIGPDSAIYHLYQETSGGPFLLGRIENPDETVLARVDYQPTPFGNINFNGRQFSFVAPGVETTYDPAAIEFYGTCYRTPTKFFPDLLPPADSYSWDFGDFGDPNNTSYYQSPIHTYSQPGTYTVTLTASIDGQDTLITQLISITDIQDSVDLGQDTVICPGEVLTLDAGPNGQLYRWNTGETGQTIDVDSAGYYWAIVDYGVCSSYDGINVEVYGVETQSANVWYFGDHAGIDFNESPPIPLSDGQIMAPQGSATISDRNGDLLFYTDGSTIYDQQHLPMFNGANIGGDNNSTQSSIIVPFPDDETMFYVFTTRNIWNPSDNYVLSYSVVDIKEIDEGTVGEVIVKDMPLFEQSTERITATNPGGFVWLVTHEFGNNTFRVYPITDLGIGTPVLTSIGSPHNIGPKETGEGYMKLSTDGSMLAVALSDNGSNYVELFQFSDSTGTLSNYVQIELPDAFPAYQVYGVEFSPNSQKLYVTVNNQSSPQSKIYEYELHNYDKASIEATVEVLNEQSSLNFGAIQIAPDGQLYVAVDDYGYLSTIFPTTDTLGTSSFVLDGFQLAPGTLSSLGLPNFVQSMMMQTPQASATVIPGCVGQITEFIGVGTSIIDQYYWDFGDGFGDSNEETSHVYNAEGTYYTIFHVTNRCGLDTLLTQNVTISGYPDDPAFNDPIICNDYLVLDADTTNTPGLSYFWNTGETTKTINVDQPGQYWVSITNPAGCTTEDTVIVYNGAVQVDLGPNLTVCQGDPVMLDAGIPVSNPPNTFTWTVNGTPVTANRYLTVDTNTPGVYQYRLTFLDGLTNCTSRDSVTITVNATPQATYTVTNTTCGNNNGSIQITSSLANLTAEWYDSGNNLLGTGASLPASMPPGLYSGVYELILSNNISGCTQNYSISVVDNDAAFTVGLTNDPDCDGDSIQVNLPGVVSPATISYTLINNTISSPPVTGAPGKINFSVPVTSEGDYTLQVTADGCTTDGNVLVVFSLTADLMVDPIFDECEGDAVIEATSATAGATFNWQGPNGFNQNGASVTVTEAGQYTVTVRDPSYPLVCDTSATVQVNISPTPDVVINPLTNGCDGTRLVGADVTSGSGSYTYLWTPNGEASPTVSILTTTDLSVTVRDQLTGCQSGDNQTVQVYPSLEMYLTIDPQPCQNENLVTIYANLTTPQPQPVTWEWYLNDFLLRDTTSYLPTFNQGLFRVEASVGECRNTEEVDLLRAPINPSYIDPEYVICPEPPTSEVAIIEPGDFVSYLAYNMESGDQIFETSPGIFEIIEEGYYTFEMENEFRCITYDTTFVDVDCLPTIYAPNAFSPYASIAENQTFRLFPSFVEDFEIFIYNRWGELVFHSDDLDFMTNTGWDGTKNGKILPLGTYAYIIRFTSLTEPERGTIEQGGGVVLLR